VKSSKILLAILPNGEIVGWVTKPYTLHYKTHKPEKDGLFYERVFEPIIRIGKRGRVSSNKNTSLFIGWSFLTNKMNALGTTNTCIINFSLNVPFVF